MYEINVGIFLILWQKYPEVMVSVVELWFYRCYKTDFLPGSSDFESP